MEKRAGAVTFKGGPVTLVGPLLKAGDKAPDFKCLNNGLAPVSLADTGAKARLFSVVPSLDTAVCSLQTKKFEDGIAGLGDKVACYTVSLDMPFAQKRFCGAENIVRNLVAELFIRGAGMTKSSANRLRCSRDGWWTPPVTVPSRPSTVRIARWNAPRHCTKRSQSWDCPSARVSTSATRSCARLRTRSSCSSRAGASWSTRTSWTCTPSIAQVGRSAMAAAGSDCLKQPVFAADDAVAIHGALAKAVGNDSHARLGEIQRHLTDAGAFDEPRRLHRTAACACGQTSGAAAHGQYRAALYIVEIGGDSSLYRPL